MSKEAIVLGDYKSLTLPKMDTAVTEQEFNQQIEMLLNERKQSAVVEREAALEDEVLIDFAGYMDGELFEGGSGQDFPLALGSGTFIPGFEEQLVGSKAGSEVDVFVTFPENYPNDMGGKEALFKVTVKEVHEFTIPTLDDAFAKEAFGMESAEDLKENMRKGLTAEKENQVHARKETLVAQQIMKVCSAEAPEEEVKAAAENLKQNFEMQLMQGGVMLDQYLAQIGMTREAYEEDAVRKASEMLSLQIVLQEIASVEGLEVTDEDVNAQLTEMAMTYRITEEEVRQAIGEEGVQMLGKQALSKKALAFLIDIADEI